MGYLDVCAGNKAGTVTCKPLGWEAAMAAAGHRTRAGSSKHLITAERFTGASS